MTFSDLEVKKYRVFSKFFAISGCDAHIESEFWPKLPEIDQDNLRIKLN